MISKSLIDETLRRNHDVQEIFSKHFSKDELKEMKKTNYIDRKESIDLEELERGSKKGNGQNEERKVEQVPDAKDRYMFPDLEKAVKKEEVISPNDILPIPPRTKKSKLAEESKGNGTWNKSANPYGYNQKTLEGGNIVNMKKKMEEDFPTLAMDVSEKSKYDSLLKVEPKKKTGNASGGWGQQPEVEEQEYYDDYEDGFNDPNAVEIVTQKKGKKSKSKVFLSGGFK